MAYMTLSYGQPPWIALSLAITFGAYGLVKKVAALNSLHGLTLETGCAVPSGSRISVHSRDAGTPGVGPFWHIDEPGLIGLGAITTLPLLAFGAAVRLLPLSTLGLLQYIAPTCQFLIGVLMYGEPFDQTRMIGFSLIWIALIALWIEGMLTQRRLHLQPAN